MTPEDHDRLLRELLTDGAVEALREKSLTQGLRGVRHRRRRRGMLSGLAVSLALFAIFAAMGSI